MAEEKKTIVIEENATEETSATLETELSALQLGDQQDAEEVPAVVSENVAKLKELQTDHEKLTAEFEKERKALELKYQQLYQPLYQQREAVVNDKTKEIDGVSGVPNFWVTALCNHDLMEQIITEKDVKALKFLTDIRSVVDEHGFKLEFVFDAEKNPYFNNTVLTKSYKVSENDHLKGQSESEEAVLEDVVGCEIDWKSKSLNLCEKTKKKKTKNGSGKIKTVTEPCTSFFNFFNPVQIPSEEDDQDMDEEEHELIMSQLDTDFQLGYTINEIILPNAVYWYTGEAENEHDSDYVDEGDEDDYEQDTSDEENNSKLTADASVTTADGEKPPECKNQ